MLRGKEIAIKKREIIYLIDSQKSKKREILKTL